MKTLSKISDWVGRCYSTPLMLGLFFVVIGFFWVFNFSPFHISNKAFIKLSGQEGLLDTMLFYSAREAYTALIHYGEEGRGFYLGFLAADFVFIIFYSVTFAFLMTVVALSVFGNGSAWIRLNVLPLGIGIFDCMENLCILGMLKIYPVNSSVLGTMSATATALKWLLTIVVISILVYGGIIIFLRYFGFRPWPASRL